MSSVKISSIISFAAGLGLGVLGTWYYLSSVYEQRFKEDLDSIKEVYLDGNPSYEPNEVVEDESPDSQINFSDYTDIIKENGYQQTDYNAVSKNCSVKMDNFEEVGVDLSEEQRQDRPYVISPEEYGEFEEYNQISLIHYSDGTLADAQDNIIDDVDEIVGSDYTSHFGEYEDDSVHIRNDSKKCDYEILIDERSWDEILESKPYLKED